MAKIAIKGHKTRGNEVIAWFEILGANNNNYLSGTEDTYYYINELNSICCDTTPYISAQFMTCTLEEFEELYPYKIGQTVITPLGKGHVYSITWSDKKSNIIYHYKEPYKENRTKIGGCTIDELKTDMCDEI